MRDIIGYAQKGRRRKLSAAQKLKVGEVFTLIRMTENTPDGWILAMETAFFAGVEAGSRFTTNKAKREAKA